MNVLHKVGLGSALFTTAAAAMAAIPEGVDTAIKGAGADALAVGALVVAAIAGLFAIRLILRIVK